MVAPPGSFVSLFEFFRPVIYLFCFCVFTGLLFVCTMSISDIERDELRVSKFNGKDGEDFELWALRMCAVLERKDLIGVVNGEDPVPDSTDSVSCEKYMRNLRKARTIIITALGDKPLRAVRSATDPSSMWKKLHERYAASTTASKIAVLTSLIRMRYTAEQDMGEYLSQLESLFSRLDAIGSSIQTDMQVAILLVSLSSHESLSGTVAAIKTMDEEKATWGFVSGRLIEEVRSQKLAYDAQGKSRNHTVALVQLPKSKSNFRCFRCNKRGHIARNCPSKSKEKQQETKDKDARQSQEEPKVRAALSSFGSLNNCFIVDSGASSHISNNINHFSLIKPTSPVKVHLADDTVVEAKHVGTVSIDLQPAVEGCDDPIRLSLRNVLYIPDAGVSMISCSQLDAAGISTVIEDGKCMFLDRDGKYSSIGYATRRNSDELFVLNGTFVSPRHKFACVSSTTSEQSSDGMDLWHRRFGHVSKSQIEQMANLHVDGINFSVEAQTIDCTNCVYSKHHKSPCTGRLVKGRVEHVIHSDIIGPIGPLSLGDGRFILCFIVEKSRYAKVYILKKRSEVESCYREFQAWLERTTGVLVKRFHSDNAKEYEALGSYFAREGIVQSFSTPYTPQSNGFTERYNRTLLGIVRSLLQESGLPKAFWGEAALHACYLTNITGGTANDGKTPHELVYDVKPNVSTLRIFGCSAFLHEPKEKRMWKLGPRSNISVLLGHADGMYRVWDMDRRQMATSKHVIVDETVFPAKNGALSVPSSPIQEDVLVDLSYLDVNAKGNTSETELQDDEDRPQVQGSGPQDHTIGTVAKTRYPQRERRAPERFVASTARQDAFDEDMPTLKQALSSDDADLWKAAVGEELKALESTGT